MASPTKLEERIQRIELEWEYRYIRLIDNEDWLKLFYFLGDFKQHCVKIVKNIVNKVASNEQLLTQFDHRFSLSKPNERVYLKDNIVIRLAKMRFENGNYVTDSFKIMNQEMITNNIVNNLFLMFLQQNSMKIRVPLTCMVDYMGYRAFCQADTTCAGSTTQLYGCTPQKGFKFNESVDVMLRKIGKHLNLKPYNVKTSQNIIISIPLSLHIQVHQARMEKYDDIRKFIKESSYLHTEIEKKPLREDYYLFNLSRIWPMYVEKNLEKNRGFLRPEYVLGWHKPLSNSAFQKLSVQVDYEGELDLADACKTLKDDRVMELVKRLDDSEIILVDSYGIATVFHEYGINLRFMGTVAEKSRMGHVKSVLSIEMVVQTLKKIFFCHLEDDSTIRQSLNDFLNLIFIRTPQSEELFTKIIYPDIKDFYDYTITDYPPNFAGGGLLHAINFHFGVDIKINDYPFFVEPQQRPLFNSVLIGDFLANATTFTLDTVELRLLVEDYKSKKRTNKSECLANLEMLMSMNRGLNHKATFTCGAYPQAIYFAEAAEIHFENQKYQVAREFALKSLQFIPEKHANAVKPYCILIKYESIKGRRGKSLEYYDEALSAIAFHLGPNHPLEISAYNVIGFEFLRHNEPQKCEKILKKSFEVCSQTLGYLHISCSQILLQLSTLPLAPSVRLNFLLQCLSILEGLKVDEAQIRSVSDKIAQLYYQIGDSKGMMTFAKKAQNRYMQIIAADRLQKYEQAIILCSYSPTTFQDTCFVIEKCFKAYYSLLDQLRARMLWKIYTASTSLFIADRRAAYKQFQSIMVNDHKTVSVLIEQSTNILLQNGKRIIETPEMYMEIENVVARMKDNRLKKMFGVFVIYISVIGPEARKIMDYDALFEKAWEKEKQKPKLSESGRQSRKA